MQCYFRRGLPKKLSSKTTARGLQNRRQ